MIFQRLETNQPKGKKRKDRGRRYGCFRYAPDESITRNRTFTFTYAEKEQAAVAKAPEAKTLPYNGAALTAVQAETEQGNLILRLKPGYLETLSLGSHSIKFIFRDGTAEASFTVRPVEGSFEDVAVPSNMFTFRKVWQAQESASITGFLQGPVRDGRRGLVCMPAEF